MGERPDSGAGLWGGYGEDGHESVDEEKSSQRLAGEGGVGEDNKAPYAHEEEEIGVGEKTLRCVWSIISIGRHES